MRTAAKPEKYEHQYLKLVRAILDRGEKRTKERTGVGTIALFAPDELVYDLGSGHIPVLTTKKIFLPAAAHEWVWMVSGNTNIAYLNANGVHIWDEWADEYGNLGPVYGHQWRYWSTAFGSGIDQMRQLIHKLKHVEQDRALIVSAWNVAELDNMMLRPCHLMFQCFVHGARKKKLSLKMIQRSADVGIGLPFNIVFYSMMLRALAMECDYSPGILTISLGDAHIYLNHVDHLEMQLLRDPFLPPTMELPKKPFLELEAGDFKFTNYKHHPAIKMDIAV